MCTQDHFRAGHFEKKQKVIIAVRITLFLATAIYPSIYGHSQNSSKTGSLSNNPPAMTKAEGLHALED